MRHHGAIRGTVRTVLLAGGLGSLLAASALAADLTSYKDMPEPVEPARKLELSANVSLTTDYVFRGFSQTDESLAIQGGFDAGYGSFYLGVWASNLDFGGAVTPGGETVDVADIEIDVYGGIKKELNGVSFDVGVIYYHYPNAFDPAAELDYWEIKGAVGYKLFHKVSASTTLFYSPEYTGEIGDNWVLEQAAEVSLGRGFKLSGLVGHQWGEESDGGFDYTYWNVGVSKDFKEKFTVAVKYWDTAELTGCGAATLFQCDSRIVGTLSASF